MKYRVYAEWKMEHYFIIEADSLDEAIEKAYDNENGCTNIGNAETIGSYVDESFVVDKGLSFAQNFVKELK